MSAMATPAPNAATPKPAAAKPADAGTPAPALPGDAAEDKDPNAPAELTALKQHYQQEVATATKATRAAAATNRAPMP